MVGNIEEGRPNLGDMTYVSMYRLMQFTLRDALVTEFGPEKADTVFFQAGKRAGEEFAGNIVRQTTDFNEFIADLQKKLKEYKVGILKVETADMENNVFSLSVAEDLDCSGLPVCQETICAFDEGFLAGIFEYHVGAAFYVKEIDCWGTGSRVCRFRVEQHKDVE